jgi:hypothetical protein
MIFMRCIYFLLVLLALVVFEASASAVDAAAPSQNFSDDTPSQHTAPLPLVEESSKVDVMWEFDPYYSDVGVNIPLTDKPIPTIRSTSESVIYSELIKDSLIPRYMLVEASVYPMPLLGTYLKTNEPDIYGRGRVGQSGVNFIESATAGFQEPWAVSAFFGNIAKIVRPGEARIGSNVGYTGYLISAGSKHIKDNQMIADHWLELEWKVKGKVDYPDEKLGWSFRVGGKLHDNINIPNVLYLNIFRTNLNAHYPFLSWISNSTLDVKLFFSENNLRLVRQEYVVGKKYPKSGWKYTPTFDIGVVWSSPEEYLGTLRTTTIDTVTLVFRPSVDF